MTQAACKEPMVYRSLLKSQVHHVSVTQGGQSCEGSCAIDEGLLEAAGIVENEQVHVWNIANGERFVACATKGQRGTGMVSVHGSAATRAAVGDLLIIAAFAQLPQDPAGGYTPRLVFR
jgi:L-aspartate-alpha-decarboxylase